MKTLLIFILMISSQVARATPINLIQNGDFSLTHTASQGGKTNFGIPDLWGGISGQTDNATVLNGVMTIATSGPRNPLYDRWYISQTFTVQNAGQYNLMFDFLLIGASTGSPMNGAKVFLDHIAASAFGITPVVVPNMIFAQTYAQEYSDILRAGRKANSWHLAQQLLLDLTAGTHTLFFSSGAIDMARSQASVSFDNISLTAIPAAQAVAAPATAILMLSGLALGLRRRVKPQL